MLIVLNMLISPKRRYIYLAISFLIHKKMINFNPDSFINLSNSSLSVWKLVKFDAHISLIIMPVLFGAKQTANSNSLFLVFKKRPQNSKSKELWSPQINSVYVDTGHL